MNLDEVERIISKGSGGRSNIHHVNDIAMVDELSSTRTSVFTCSCLCFGLYVFIFLSNSFFFFHMLMEQVISYLRGPFLFVFNFHPTNSYQSYSIGVEEAGEYHVSEILCLTIIWHSS